MQLQYEVTVTVEPEGEFFRARACGALMAEGEGRTAVNVPLVTAECESREVHLAISHALAELSAKIGSGR